MKLVSGSSKPIAITGPAPSGGGPYSANARIEALRVSSAVLVILATVPDVESQLIKKRRGTHAPGAGRLDAVT